jgi:hypothetical protein
MSHSGPDIRPLRPGTRRRDLYQRCQSSQIKRTLRVFAFVALTYFIGGVLANIYLDWPAPNARLASRHDHVHASHHRALERRTILTTPKSWQH